MGRPKLLALVALLVVGCSSAGPSPGATLAPAPTPTPAPTPLPSPTIDPVIARIRDAATATIAARTVGFDQSATFMGNLTIKDGTAITGRGSLSFGSPSQSDVNADYSALSLGTMRMIQDDQSLYLSGSFLRALIPAGKWLLVDLRSKDPRAVPFLQITKGQNDNSLVMYALFGAVSPVEYVGSEDVDGVATSHFRFGLDLELAPDAAPATAREHLLDAIAALRAAGTARTIDGQVWVGSDGYVHRVSYTYTYGRVAGGGTFTVVYTFRDFGTPLHLGIPKASTVVRLEALKP